MNKTTILAFIVLLGLATTAEAGGLYTSPIFGSSEQKIAVIYVVNTGKSPVTVVTAEVFDFNGVPAQKFQDTCTAIQLGSKSTCAIATTTISPGLAYSGSLVVKGSATKIRAVLEMQSNTSTVGSQILR